MSKRGAKGYSTPAGERKSPPVNITMPRELLEQLRAHAAASERTVSAIVRAAVQSYLDKGSRPT